MSEASATAQCPHCGTPVEGPDDVWCCAGCEMAAAIIRGAGLERYYAEREAFPPRPEGQAMTWAEAPVEIDDEGRCAVGLAVDGLRCASCVWVTENVLQRTPGVVEARISYGSGRALLRWDPAVTSLPALARTISTLGYRPRLLGAERAADRDLIVRLGVAAFGALNVMLLSAAIYTGWMDRMDPRFIELFHWLALGIATPVALWSAAPFFRGAWMALRHGVLHMDLPIAIAVAALYLHGVAATAFGLSEVVGDPYLDSLTMVVALLLAGRLLESRGRRRAAEAAVALAAVVPATARRLDTAGSVEVIAADRLEPGDRVVVGPGEEFAADGVVAGGEGVVKMALLTGESEPVAVAEHDRVFAGTLLEDGALEVRVTAGSEDTVVRRMAEELRRAADRATAPTAADRLAPWFTGITLAVAAGTFAMWFGLAGTAPALRAAVAVLVVACPCALALAQPLAAAAGLGAAARRGLLFRDADALLALADADTAALDKTGTVTGGDMVVVRADDAVLRVAAGLERYSVHPIARAVLREAADRGIPLPAAVDVREEAGRGVDGWVDGRRWTLERGGPSRVDLVADDGSREPILLGDRIRSDSREAVEALRDLGFEVVLLTGDDLEPARHMAARAGVDEVLARRTPLAKTAWIEQRRAEGRTVVFVGDGLNDGPALAAASVGVAMGSGAASSILAADGVLASGSLRPLGSAVRAARAARRAIRVNLTRSVVYNVVAVAAAATGIVNPLVAAILMPLSSGLVLWGASGVERAVRRAEGGAPGQRGPIAAPGDDRPARPARAA
ncbi:heavy metal translocating P-type ATPase [Gaopeijia maritima]|uniref:Heavy metal translocating P-type ATPase metal-binding domain-containing protein n=1 Tax=Gaopeijia maritima TaxID=3119007 RepID=A0ABU9EDL6_9BACT